MDAARWSRFAAKGGIGDCTAAQDCVAERAEDSEGESRLAIRNLTDDTVRTTNLLCLCNYPTKRACIWSAAA